MPSDYVAIKTFMKCDPLLVQLLYFMVYFSDDKRAEVTEAFNSTFSYFDYLLNIDHLNLKKL